MPTSEDDSMLNLSTSDKKKDFFTSQLQPPQSDVDAWVWLAYDQLNLALLTQIHRVHSSLGIILIESRAKGKSRPYHKQKLASLLSSQRHFAIEAQHEGYPVHYVVTQQGYLETLQELTLTLGPLHCIEQAERSTRMELKPLLESGELTAHPHIGWLTSRSLFLQSVGKNPPFRMDSFYRNVRKTTGWFMHDGKPIGEKYSFDEANRKFWKGNPPAPEAPVYSIDEIDQGVHQLVEQVFNEHPGHVDLSQFPTSQSDLEQAKLFAQNCLSHFGTYEDAMSSKSRGLFHTRTAPLLNLHRIMPEEAVEWALTSDAELNNTEGFLRQLIWREYVHHVHEVTDGFRTLDVKRTPSRRDANWYSTSPIEKELHPNHLEQTFPLPQAYWGQKSGLACLDASVESVLEDGWTHHIPRLMVLSNIAHLIDVNPRELTDWFHVAFIDAYDWVVEPNVLGMGTFATGSAMMTKPYVAGSAYINRMSDHCSTCSFHPKKTCPISRLYWAYLARHSPSFAGNHRLSMAMRNVAKRSDEQRELDHLTFMRVQQTLAQGGTLHPEDQ